MKMLTAILALAATAGNLRAQDVRADAVPAPDMGAIEAHYAFAVRPYVRKNDMSVSRFWTVPTIALIVLDGAAKAADAYATRKNIAGGGVEYDPLARPFVHTAGVQVASMAALLGGEIMGAYLLHRRRHEWPGHAVLAAGALMNGLGAAFSIKHRVADW
ncbi:MAG TPA: hypothetical protein VK828_03980 [Terriglobales bacterium]|jgi:hypothetical protein|nr:hypothetical protein [Terriglobales bacterium]